MLVLDFVGGIFACADVAVVMKRDARGCWRVASKTQWRSLYRAAQQRAKNVLQVLMFMSQYDDEIDNTSPLSHLAPILEQVAVFPLRNTVFFPHTLLPLHIFEPRYRQMVEDALNDHGCIAIALADDDDELGFARVVGLGRIVNHIRLPDGRFHILLYGLTRVAVESEVPQGGLLYRRIKGHAIHDINTQDLESVQHELTTLRSCYGQLMQTLPEGKNALHDLPHKIEDPSILSDIVCAAVIDDVDERQSALSDADLLSRLRRARDGIAHLLLCSMTTDETCIN